MAALAAALRTFELGINCWMETRLERVGLESKHVMDLSK